MRNDTHIHELRLQHRLNDALHGLIACTFCCGLVCSHSSVPRDISYHSAETKEEEGDGDDSERLSYGI